MPGLILIDRTGGNHQTKNMKSSTYLVRFLLTNKYKPCHETDGQTVSVEKLDLTALTIFTTVNQTPESVM